MPAAAPTFSTMIDCPSISLMRCAWMRALTSTPPPAANGTTSVIGRAGQSCAAAGPVKAHSAATAAVVVLRMSCSLSAHTRAPDATDQGLTVSRPTLLRRRAESPRPAGGGKGEGPDARRSLEHDPEKWVPVFGKRSCSTKRLERDDDSSKSHPALTGGSVLSEAIPRALAPC